MLKVSPCGTQSRTPATICVLLRRIAVFGINPPKIDKPDEVAFAKEISKNLPNKEDSTKLWYGLTAAYVAGKVLRNVKDK